MNNESGNRFGKSELALTDASTLNLILRKLEQSALDGKIGPAQALLRFHRDMTARNAVKVRVTAKDAAGRHVTLSTSLDVEPDTRLAAEERLSEAIGATSAKGMRATKAALEAALSDKISKEKVLLEENLQLQEQLSYLTKRLSESESRPAPPPPSGE